MTNQQRIIEHLPWIIPLVLLITWVIVGFTFMMPYNIYKIEEQRITELQKKNEVLQQQYRPILTINDSTKVSVINDEKKQITTFNIDFHIENIGNTAAYLLSTKIYFAPKRNPQEIYGMPEQTDTNPLHSHVETLVTQGISQPFSKSNDVLYIQNIEWYIYVLLKYTDAPDDGNMYSEEYWFYLDLNSNSVRSLTPDEKQEFQPYVNKHNLK